MIKVLTLLLLCSSVAYAKPIVLYGNQNGLWSPNGSIANLPTLPPQSRAIYNSPVFTPPPPVITEPEVMTEPEVCPTYQSAPHLCQ